MHVFHSKTLYSMDGDVNLQTNDWLKYFVYGFIVIYPKGCNTNRIKREINSVTLWAGFSKQIVGCIKSRVIKIVIPLHLR